MPDLKMNDDGSQPMAVTVSEIYYDLQYVFHFSDINQLTH